MFRASDMSHVRMTLLVVLSFRFAVRAGRSEFVKFMCVEENALCDMCHTRNYIIISDASLCPEEPMKCSRYSGSVASIIIRKLGFDFR